MAGGIARRGGVSQPGRGRSEGTFKGHPIEGTKLARPAHAEFDFAVRCAS
jgi:hypothetical protein